MKKVAIYLSCLLMLAVYSPFARAQEKGKTDEKSKAEASSSTPVKVQIVFTEFEGDKKLKSLPYVLYVNAADASELKPGWNKLRIGSRVPVYTGNNQVQYIDVGTNIDARASYTGENRLLLQLSFEHSWVEGNVPVPVTKSDTAQGETSGGHFPEPIIRSFKSDLDLKLREGQSVESTVAADPISGKIAKAEVSFTLVK